MLTECTSSFSGLEAEGSCADYDCGAVPRSIPGRERSAVSSERPVLPLVLAVGLPGLWLGLHARRYFPFFSDDGFISLRYSERLLDGQGLTWTDGEAVEGYSNLLWVLGCALLGAFGIDLIVAARILGVVSMLGIFVAVFRWGRLIDPAGGAGALAANLGLAGLATSAVWAIGGLEEALYGALLAFAWVEMAALLTGTGRPGAATRAGVAFGLACWTRPDGPLFVAIAAAALVLRYARDRATLVRTVAWVVGIPVALVLAQLGFRLGTYGDWLPNPARIKGSITVGRMGEGFGYLGEIAMSYAPLTLLAWPLVGRLRGPEAASARTLAGFLLVNLGAWSAYVASVGGDIFPAHRHGLVIAVLVAMIAVIAFARWSAVPGARWGWAGLTAGVLAILAVQQPAIGENRRAERERWEWDGQVIAEVLGRAPTGRPPLVAATAAGTIPYFSKLPSIDMLGLNDRTIARLPARGRALAHDHGDGPYVLSRKPDVIVFNVGSGPSFVYKRDFRAPGSSFPLDYVPVMVQGYEPHLHRGLVYIRRDGVLGLKISDRRVKVPGYLLGSTVAEIDGRGQLVGRFEPPGGSTFRFALPEGQWRTTLPQTLSVTLGAGLAARVDCPLVDVQGPAELAVTLTGDVGVQIADLTFERIEDELLSPWPSVRCAATLGPGPVVADLADFATWTFAGTGFDDDPHTASSMLRGFDGPFASSQHGDLGALASGTAWSAPFDVPEGAFLSVRVAGGAQPRDLGLRVWSGDRAVRGYVPPKPGVAFHDVVFDLSDLAGRTARLELRDRAAREWGFIALDAATLHTRSATDRDPGEQTGAEVGDTAEPDDAGKSEIDDERHGE